MTDKKPLLEHQKQRLELAIDEISTPIFSTKPALETSKAGFFVKRQSGDTGYHILTQIISTRFHIRELRIQKAC